MGWFFLQNRTIYLQAITYNGTSTTPTSAGSAVCPPPPFRRSLISSQPSQARTAGKASTLIDCLGSKFSSFSSSPPRAIELHKKISLPFTKKVLP
jgi:hypothetical protein